MSAVATTSEPRSTTLAGTSSGACWMKRESCAAPSQATPRIRSAAQIGVREAVGVRQRAVGEPQPPGGVARVDVRPADALDVARLARRVVAHHRPPPRPAPATPSTGRSTRPCRSHTAARTPRRRRVGYAALRDGTPRRWRVRRWRAAGRANPPPPPHTGVQLVVVAVRACRRGAAAAPTARPVGHHETLLPPGRATFRAATTATTAASPTSDVGALEKRKSRAGSAWPARGRAAVGRRWWRGGGGRSRSAASERQHARHPLACLAGRPLGRFGGTVDWRVDWGVGWSDGRDSRDGREEEGGGGQPQRAPADAAQACTRRKTCAQRA